MVGNYDKANGALSPRENAAQAIHPAGIPVKGPFRHWANLSRTWLRRTLACSLALAAPSWARAQSPSSLSHAEVSPSPDITHEQVENFLARAELERGYEKLKQQIAAEPADAEARLGAAIVSVVRGIERLAQTLYQSGIRTESPGLNFPPQLLAVLENPEPPAAKYQDLRLALERFLEDLGRAEQELIALEQRPELTSLKLRLRPGRIHLDVNGNGHAEPQESLAQMMGFTSPATFSDSLNAPEFELQLDAGDVYWLHGYCRLVTAWGRCVLAYDEKELFHKVGHLLFQRVETPYKRFRRPNEPVAGDSWLRSLSIMDLIAGIHLMDFPLQDAGQLKQARLDFLEVIKLSRLSWAAIEAETDNDHEWIPSARQTSPFPHMPVALEQITAWKEVLDELELLLEGKKLAPYWRQIVLEPVSESSKTYGVNIRRVFEEPQDFDLVLWIQGSAVDPYLEQGTVSMPEGWNRRSSPLGALFMPYSFWFN